SAPAMSIVLVADTFETIRETVEHLRRQTVHDLLELVIAAPSEGALGLDGEACNGFHAIRVVEVGSFELQQRPRAAAIRAARAPLVPLGEGPASPEPEALEMLLARHGEPWAVVGQVICNGNPRSSRSWAHLLMDYGQWMAGTPGGPVGHLPAYNSSYKRA